VADPGQLFGRLAATLRRQREQVSQVVAQRPSSRRAVAKDLAARRTAQVSPMMEEAAKAGPRSDEASEQRAYYELQCYTLALGDLDFIHQHVVDAWAAQQADERTKPIALTFALVGLYLHVEKRISGRQVQRVHMALGRRKRKWPAFVLPRERGPMTAARVMAAPAGPERDRAIDAWCASVWDAFSENRRAVAELLAQHGIV
jgi:hypothetical protein